MRRIFTFFLLLALSAACTSCSGVFHHPRYTHRQYVHTEAGELTVEKNKPKLPAEKEHPSVKGKEQVQVKKENDHLFEEHHTRASEQNIPDKQTTASTEKKENHHPSRPHTWGKPVAPQKTQGAGKVLAIIAFTLSLVALITAIVAIGVGISVAIAAAGLGLFPHFTIIALSIAVLALILGIIALAIGGGEGLGFLMATWGIGGTAAGIAFILLIILLVILLV